MARMIREDTLKTIIFRELEEWDAKHVWNLIHNTPKADVIPITFIKDFSKTHDPVYQSNLASLIKAYNQEVPERDRVPEDFL